MPDRLKLFTRKTRDGRKIWHYRGTLAGNRLRGTTGTTDRKRAAEIAAEIEKRFYKGDLVPEEGLTFPQAVELYLKAGKGSTKRETLYIGRLEDYWKNTKVKDMTAGAIRQSAIDIHPDDSGATRSRQVVTVTRAIINHCADLNHCSPIRVKGFAHEKKIKKPVTVEWLDTFCSHARPLNKALALFMFAVGARISDARRLEWSNIDFQQRSILLVKTKAKKQRVPHMPQRLLVALANLPRNQKPFGDIPETRLRQEWDEDIAKAAEAVPGFVRLTFHSCKHGIITKLLHDKVDIKTVSSITGTSVGVILSNYAHAMNDSDPIDRIFDTQENGKNDKVSES